MADASIEDNAAARGAAPEVDDKAAMIARNKAAMAKRKAAQAAAKAAEAAQELPTGWTRVESRSRPGEFVYENIHTEERQAWFPDKPAVEESVPSVDPEAADKAALMAKNKAALLARKAAKAEQQAALKDAPLPAGWIRSESRSRPGEVVYENSVSGERQAWFPDAPCISEEEMEKQALKERNAAALAARKSAMKSKADAEAAKPLPAGWKRVESRSRPGEFVYENTLTEERQAWLPDAPAKGALPEGWRKVESRSYPGEFVYENVHTMERQAWEPVKPAPLQENQVEAPPKAAAAPAPEAVIVAVVRAEYGYTADNQDEEIDLMEGDLVDVEYKADNGWWVGRSRRSGRSGIFPGSYCTEVE
jgi:hypothetical protein